MSEKTETAAKADDTRTITLPASGKVVVVQLTATSLLPRWFFAASRTWAGTRAASA